MNKVFSGNYDEMENIVLGNSRSYSIIFNSKEEKNLNFSYNEMTFENLVQILQAINEKSPKSNIYIEITSLITDKYNCSYHVFLSHEYFNEEILKEKCKFQYFLSKFLPLYKANSDLFYRTFFYYLSKKNDQSYVSGDKYDKSVCENNEIGFYDFTIKNNKTLEDIENKLHIIKKKFSNLKIKFFILPYHKASMKLLKNFELDLNYKYNDSIIFLNQKINSSFYNNCENFLDRIHLSKKGILEIDFKNKI